jgi:hypothetical protein
MGLAYRRWKEGPFSKVITKRYSLRPLPGFKQPFKSYPDQPGSRPTGGCASVVPGFCTSDADPNLFFPIGNAGPRCFSWTRPNGHAVHSPYAVPGAGPGQRPGGRRMGSSSEPERRALRRMRHTPVDEEPT